MPVWLIVVALLTVVATGALTLVLLSINRPGPRQPRE
jgi:hypothetical protein